MPLKASQMAINVAEISVEYGDSTVNVSFYPDKFNNKIIALLDGKVDGFDQALCELIKSWDVLEDDGSMTPLVPERLATLSFPFRVKVAKAITGTMRPNSQEA